MDLEARATTRYETSTGIRVVVCVSKRYYGKTNDFWFGFHPRYQTFLQDASEVFVALACGSAEHVFFIPWSEFEAWLPKLNRKPTEKFWWYLPIDERDGKFVLKLKGGSEAIDLSKYLL